jgi:RNA-directed DNA polymerase
MADRVVVPLICVQQNAQGGKDPERWVFRRAKGGRGEMTKAPSSLQDLRRRIDRKAKSDKAHRFWGLFGHVAKSDPLAEAYHHAQRHGGAPGLDGQTFADIEAGGVERCLADIQADLLAGTSQPQPPRAVDIPKKHGKVRRLQIPCMRDRVVQGALKLILEAIFEADFCPHSYGDRPRRSPPRALAEVRRSVLRRMTTVIEVD